MADKISSTSTLQMIAEFGDGYEKTISQDDPTSENLIAKVKAFTQFAVENKVLASDKSDATITRIKSAKIIERSVVNYDLS